MNLLFKNRFNWFDLVSICVVTILFQNNQTFLGVVLSVVLAVVSVVGGRRVGEYK